MADIARVSESGVDKSKLLAEPREPFQDQSINDIRLRLRDAKQSKTTFLSKIWSSLLLPSITPPPVEATWTTFFRNLVFHFSLSLFGRPACASQANRSPSVTRRFQHIDLALTEFYEATGNTSGAERGTKYVLAEALPARPIPSLSAWYELVTVGPPAVANRHPMYHASTKLVGWSHINLVIVEPRINENGQKDFKGLQWDLSSTTGISQIEKKEWTWRESSVFLPLGTTTMDEQQIEALAQQHLKKYPVYHLVFRNCAFFVMMMFGAINARKDGDLRRVEGSESYSWLTMNRLSLLLALSLVLAWYELVVL